jgi:hypothetical protein
MKIREALRLFVNATADDYDKWILWQIKEINDLAAEALALNDWQPIETAPKDDKALYGYWTQFDNWYTHLFTGSHEPIIYGYTHWQPLPEPPKLSSTLDAATKITMVDITNLKTTMKNQDR